MSDNRLLAVGFARYDSTRGGAQSDDRTGGNSNKVDKIKRYCEKSNKKLKIIFFQMAQVFYIMILGVKLVILMVLGMAM